MRRRHFWVVKLARSFLKDLHFKGTKKDFTVNKFSKVNAVRKESKGLQLGRRLRV